jgi:methyl-accepting chemotaxis protein
MSANSAVASERVALGERIGSRIIRSMQSLRSTTEQVVLSIGEQVNRIVQVVTHDNEAVRQTLHDLTGSGHSSGENDRTVTRAISDQASSVAGLVAETKEFFGQQKCFAEAASEACDRINSCASSVSDLMVKSRLLALNMQIEAARLGAEGKAFQVIGDEMKSFAGDVRSANDTIKVALGALLTAIPSIKSETARMDGRVTEFADQLAGHIDEVRARTEDLTTSLQAALDRAEARNAAVVQSAQVMLSELQFQDPLKQELQRDEFDVTKLQKIIAIGECEDISLAEIDPAVGEDGSDERTSGAIELF